MEKSIKYCLSDEVKQARLKLSRKKSENPIKVKLELFDNHLGKEKII
jgi:hypothetical protein